MQDVYTNFKEYKSSRKCNILKIFEDIMIADMLSNKKLNPIVTELFIRGRKFKHFFCFYCGVFFCCNKKYEAKFYTVLL